MTVLNREILNRLFRQCAINLVRGPIFDQTPPPLPPDDTQLAFWTLEQMLEDGRFVPAHVAEHFSRGRIHGIGSTMKQFLRNYRSGIPWEQCALASAGNGALMRIAPILIPHLRTATAELWTKARRIRWPSANYR